MKGSLFLAVFSVDVKSRQPKGLSTQAVTVEGLTYSESKHVSLGIQVFLESAN